MISIIIFQLIIIVVLIAAQAPLGMFVEIRLGIAWRGVKVQLPAQDRWEWQKA